MTAPWPELRPLDAAAFAVVERLRQRFGDLGAASRALGVRPDRWGLWREGRVSPSTLARLRQAAMFEGAPPRAAKKTRRRRKA